MYSCVPQRRGLKHYKKGKNMDELQKLMGDSYKEGLTVEDITNFMKGKNFADLSQGGYVDKNKYEADINDYKKQISDRDNTIKTKDNELKSIVNFTMDKRGSLYKRMGFGRLNAVSQIFAKFNSSNDFSIP